MYGFRWELRYRTVRRVRPVHIGQVRCTVADLGPGRNGGFSRGHCLPRRGAVLTMRRSRWPPAMGGRAWRDVRVVEGARLESVCTPKRYRGFESLSLRQVFRLRLAAVDTPSHPGRAPYGQLP